MARDSPPAESDALKRWVLDSLLHSTRVLSKDVVSTQIADDVCTMLARMSRGHEGEHLNLLYNVLDNRGSDVRLDSGLILEGLGKWLLTRRSLGTGHRSSLTLGLRPNILMF